jgi:hypothetical protein
MRKITIVGAGQFGLHLGVALRRKNYDVTIVTNRSGEQIGAGRVLSSQILFTPVLAMEEALGLNPWADGAGRTDGTSFTVADGAGHKLLSWDHAMPGRGGQSVDQRVKIPVWMEMFEAEGGRLLIEDVDADRLESLAVDCDLLIVAAGKGDISGLFERDEEKSGYAKPQRQLCMVYVHGMRPDALGGSTSRYVQVPGVGEYVTFPCLTLTGACDILMFESHVGGPIHDLLKDAKDAETLLVAGVKVLDMIAPWEADRCRELTVTDAGGWLAGAVTPTVRKPIAHLPSGKAIMGGGDVVILNDPLTGQGSNNASKHADVVLEAILAHGDAPFDEAFMRTAFEAHWEKAQWVCRFTNLMLNPNETVASVMMGMIANPRLRADFLAGFADASTYADWLFDQTQAIEKIAAYA